VAEVALRAGQDGVVVGEHGAGAALAEEVPIDARRPADQPVARRPLDQLLDAAAAALRGDREAPVLHEAAGVDQVLDVLARRAATCRAAALDRVRPRVVERLRAAREQLVEVVALVLRHARKARTRRRGHPPGPAQVMR
jgi:hypothetical protein